LNPVIVPYAMTVTQVLWMASLSGTNNSTGALTVSVGLYTINGGTAGSLSLASSATSQFTWTTGAGYSSSSGVQYRSMTVGSWSLTPGAYVFAFGGSSSNAGTQTFYGLQSVPSLASGMTLTNMVAPGYWGTSTGAFPTSMAVSATGSWIRTGASAMAQPWAAFLGT
jgi:hypothetical protein